MLHTQFKSTKSTVRKVKVKVQLRTCHEGPEKEYRCTSALVRTSALNDGGWSKPRTGHYTPGKETWYRDLLCKGVENLTPIGFRFPDRLQYKEL